MSSKKRNIYIFLGKVILITLLIVFCIRTFLIEPYTVSSVQMKTTLLNGDKILIDKTAYGIRLPMTILSIPFTSDKYSTAVKLPYKRLFESSVKRNDVVLFNNPADTSRPLDKRELLLSRCVALPGDTIQTKDGVLLINGKQYISSPDVTGEYFIKSTDKKELMEVLDELHLSPQLTQISDTTFFQLNRLEAFILDKSLPDSISVIQLADSTGNYSFLIPSKGKTINLDTQSLAIYGQTILQEQGTKARLTDEKLTLDGKEQKEYTFQDNYYWMLSDNTLNSADSRSLGLIPFKNIIGKARFLWYSSENKNENRSFSSIK